MNAPIPSESPALDARPPRRRFARRLLGWTLVAGCFVGAFATTRSLVAGRGDSGDGAPPDAARPSSTPPVLASEPRFEAWDLLLDPAGGAIAAWQIAIEPADDGGERGAARLVGVEGGDRAPFDAPPAYDPAALGAGRVVIASFTLADAADLPRTPFRAATLHYRIAAPADLASARVRVEAAVDHDGRPLTVTATLLRRTTP